MKRKMKRNIQIILFSLLPIDLSASNPSLFRKVTHIDIEEGKGKKRILEEGLVPPQHEFPVKKANVDP